MSAIKLTSKDYYNTALEKVKSQLKDMNSLAVPRITKVVINTGIGNRYEKAQKDEIVDQIERLTGQIPRKLYSKDSISGFKLRAGELVGASVTLRGQKMKDFLLNLIYIALPRTKDFKGVNPNAWDTKHSSFSIGIRDASIFPQVGFSAKTSFGLQVNVCFAEGKKENTLLLEALKFPLQKTKK